MRFPARPARRLPGVKLQLFGEDAAPLDAPPPMPPGSPRCRGSAPPATSAPRSADDTYITAFDHSMETVGLWHFPVRYSWNTPAESSRQAFLFTDRSLYRPGETVRLKGIVRTLHGNAIEARGNRPARIVIIDPTDKRNPQPAGHHLAQRLVRFHPQARAAENRHPHDPSRVSRRTRRRRGDRARLEPTRADSSRARASRCRCASRSSAATPSRSPSASPIRRSAPPPSPPSLSAKYYQGQPVAAGEVKYYSRITAAKPLSRALPGFPVRKPPQL